jgi:hypothetical protein
MIAMNGPDESQIAKIRRQRNLVMALLLAAFVVLVFAISIARMS